ncbi:hypothetical protein ACSWFU_004260 [Vibrio vulnificus]
MNKKILEEQIGFLQFIRNYEYIDPQGRLDLEAFCVNLSICFSCDGVLDKSPQPRDMYNLLIDLLAERASDNEMSLWVQRQKVLNWTHEMSHIYPEGYSTRIHVAGLVYVMPLWIYHIGNTLMKISNTGEDKKYFYWVKSNWAFVHTFINGFHDFYASFLKKVDMNHALEEGYSLFEALHKSTTEGINYDNAIKQLNNRGKAQNKAIKRIEAAIDSKFYLEAITLQENLISNCLYNYLKSKGEKAKNLSFCKLLNGCKSITGSNVGLINELDRWRVKRNEAIHGYIEAEINLLSESEKDFLSFSKITADEGKKLCQSVCEWYLQESLNFVATEFKDSHVSLH